VVTNQALTKEVELWGVSLPTVVLEQSDIDYLVKVASMACPPVEWMWQEIDRVWDILRLDNRELLQGQAIGTFYSHPVWVVNGVFSATDPISVQHRDSIASFVSRLGVSHVSDYGGGFGELALRLRAAAPQIQVTIVEPYPSKLGIQRVKGDDGIHFIKEFDSQYDCVIAQDVLEHVEQPLELAVQLVEATKSNGYLIFANCFYPLIRCHLPSTFYLRHTFSWVARGMGLKLVGRVPGAPHALVFQRVGDVDSNKIKQLSKFAEFVGPFLNAAYSLLVAIKRKVM